MLTYVINTSENKVLKSEILFELVGYNRIVWMRSGLGAIENCAEEILRRQEPMTASEYRVVVLVDFLAFEKTLFPEENPVSEYLAIYRKLIEIYLYNHLYAKLNRARLGFDGLEVFYIQYCEKNTIRENAAEKAQLADVIGLGKETEDGEENTVKKKNVFQVKYDNGALLFRAEEFCRETKVGEEVDIDCFFSNYNENYNIAYRAFGSHSRTYVAESASAKMESRAAFDNLNLSLALIHAYEQDLTLNDGDDRDDVVDIPKMNKNVFFDIIRKAYGKVQAALEYVRQSGKADGFYRLEVGGKEVTEDILCSELKEEEKQAVTAKAKALGLEKQYVDIKRLASQLPGEKSDEEKEELSEYMKQYKEGRDELRNDTDGEDVSFILQDAPKQSKYPSGLEFENAVEKKKKTMRKILKDAIYADYGGADYTKEFEEANEVYDRYKRAEAALAKNFRTHLSCLVLVLVAMIVPYIALQKALVSFVGGTLFSILAVAVFGGVYILSAFIHMIPLLRARSLAKIRMTQLYEACLLKQSMAMLKLKRRYVDYLPAVEKIRYEIYKLQVLHDANREINRHIEEHREMLEKLRDVLLGMLNSMQVAHKANADVALDEDEFKINESFRANRIYKVFTLDAIEKIFEEGGM